MTKPQCELAKDFVSDCRNSDADIITNRFMEAWGKHLRNDERQAVKELQAKGLKVRPDTDFKFYGLNSFRLRVSFYWYENGLKNEIVCRDIIHEPSF